jgi:hypothetical protein
MLHTEATDISAREGEIREKNSKNFNIRRNTVVFLF